VKALLHSFGNWTSYSYLSWKWR